MHDVIYNYFEWHYFNTWSVFVVDQFAESVAEIETEVARDDTECLLCIECFIIAVSITLIKLKDETCITTTFVVDGALFDIGIEFLEEENEFVLTFKLSEADGGTQIVLQGKERLSKDDERIPALAEWLFSQKK